MIRDLISSLRVATSLLPFERAAREAILLRCSRLAGSCAQQSPCGPLAGSVQSSPFALVSRHLLIYGFTPFLSSVLGSEVSARSALQIDDLANRLPRQLRDVILRRGR